MSAHTPGPWTGDKPVVYDNNGRMVADCRSTLMGDVDAEGDYANARLIAAAPELVGALNAMLVAYTGGSEYAQAARAQAVDALAKAGV